MTVVQKNSPDLDNLMLDTVRVFGVMDTPDSVTSQPISDSLTFTHNPDTKVCGFCHPSKEKVLFCSVLLLPRFGLGSKNCMYTIYIMHCMLI